jgi:hypothetical protein
LADELGFLAERRGQAAEAGSLHLRALRGARTLGAPRDVAMALAGLAGAAGLGAAQSPDSVTAELLALPDLRGPA